ncbi:MAG: LiaI-LiaF-like domain-containing protein [bacterium]
MHDKQNSHSANLWVAIGLIAIGFLFLLDNLYILDIGHVWDYWPLIFVAIGLLKLKSSNHQDKTSASFFIGFGVLFLLLELDIFDWHTIWQFWPVVLILIGLSIIYRRSRENTQESSDASSDAGSIASSENRIDVVTVFAGNEKKIVADNFEGGSITTICGGTELDFDGAKLSRGRNVIDVFTLCGGTELMVPSDWNVEIKGFPLFGAFEDARRKTPTEGTGPDKTLVIKGLVIFGGLEIKNT